MKARCAIVAAIIFSFGIAKFSVEERLTREHEAAFFRGAKLDRELRQEIGQLAFVAALGGFRAPVADMLWIQAHTAWENMEWGRLALLLNNVVTLQPRSIMFWDTAAWHMAWNASVAAFNDTDQKRKALRVKAQREYFDLGKRFIKRGIENNPDSYELLQRMGFLQRDKYRNPCAAAAAFRMAAELENAPAYLKRFAAYETARCPQTQRQGYRMLRELYLQSEEDRFPTLRTLLGELEEELNVPEEQRVYNVGAHGGM